MNKDEMQTHAEPDEASKILILTVMYPSKEVLRLLREACMVADRMVRKGMWSKEFMEKESFHELYGKTLGIIGFGIIGQRVSTIANVLGMKILVVDQVTPDPLLLEELDAEFVSLKELLRRSDIVSLHVPSTSQTRHMISEKEFQIMKDSTMHAPSATTQGATS